MLIADAHAEKLRAQLPEWYRAQVDAAAFVLFPVVLGKNPVGLFYADVRSGPLRIERNEANLPVTLRNQAVLAFKQAALRLRAAWVAQELLKTFEEELGEVALKPGGGGDFIVRVDGRELFSRKTAGRYPEAKELKELVRDAIGSEKHVGHPGRGGAAPAA